MIQFHKVLNVPKTNVEPTQEHIWFSGEGSLHVANSEGIPTQIGLGFKEVNSIPTGEPQKAGLMRYVKSNRKYYFSTEREWLELGTTAQAGSSSGPGYAAGVIVADSGNHYVSGDVEGALLEIGQSLAPSKGVLPNFKGDLFNLNSAGEHSVVSGSTSTPAGGGFPFWLMQRKDASGNILGLVVDKDGRAFTRFNRGYSRLASHTELTNLKNNVESTNSLFFDYFRDLTEMKIAVGPGLKISDDGLLHKNPTITFDTSTNEEEEEEDGGVFVKKSGDTMTGNLVISENGQFKIVANDTAVIALQSKLAGSRYYQMTARADEYQIADHGTGIAPIRWNSADKKLYINDFASGVLTPAQQNSGNSANGIIARGAFQIISPNQNGVRVPTANKSDQYALYVDNDTSLGNIAIFRGGDAALGIRSHGASGMRVESVDAANQSSKNLVFTGKGGGLMSTFKVEAKEVQLAQNLQVSNALHIGASLSNPNRGEVNVQNRILMFPRRNGSQTSGVTDKAIFMGVKDTTLEILGVTVPSDPSRSVADWAKHTIKVQATNFVNSSTETLKKNIEEWEKPALDIIDEAKVYKYHFKDQEEEEKRNLGFIIERGVPEEAITEDKQAVDSYALLAVLWKAVQELSAEVAELRRA